MKSLAGHTILVTGGASGIGFALASRFAKAGSTVIICGRREDQLEWAKKQVPALITVRGDVSTDTGRVALFEKVSKEYPKVDMLVNNAGIQNRLPPLTVEQDWSKYKSEIAINYEAPIHLTMLFLPHFMKLEAAYIMNVTSGLSFVPLSFLAGYFATKAGMHSFTLSLRHQLKDTKVKVIECIPPAVNTDLGGKGLHDTGVPLDVFADHAMKCLEKGDVEFAYEFSENARTAAQPLQNFFDRINPL